MIVCCDDHVLNNSFFVVQYLISLEFPVTHFTQDSVVLMHYKGQLNNNENDDTNDDTKNNTINNTITNDTNNTTTTNNRLIIE